MYFQKQISTQKTQFFNNEIMLNAITSLENLAFYYGYHGRRKYDCFDCFSDYTSLGNENQLIKKFISQLELLKLLQSYSDFNFPPNLTRNQIISDIKEWKKSVNNSTFTKLCSEFINCLNGNTVHSGIDFMKNPKCTSGFILFEDYKSYFILLHKKLSEFFDENYSSLSYKSSHKQNFINFINSKNIKEKNKIIEWVNSINSGTVSEFIQAYTGETPLCYSLNKWMRECKKDDFEKIKYFAGPFSYSLYKYAHDNSKMKVNYSKNFYRKMVISLMDYESYKENIGKLICYPAFTSVSEKDMTKYNFPTQLAKGINNIKSDDISVILYIYYKCNNSFYHYFGYYNFSFYLIPLHYYFYYLFFLMNYIFLFLLLYLFL